MSNLKSKPNTFINTLNEQYGKYARVVAIMSFVLCLLLYFVGTAIWFNLFFVILFVVLVQFLAYIAFKKSLDEKATKLCTKLFIASITVLICALISWPFITLGRATGMTSVAKTSALAFSAVAIVGVIVFCISDTGKKAIDGFKALEPKFAVGIEEAKPGDLRLCLDTKATKDSGKDVPEYLKLKDRYLHTLVLGPTGCGKTSQVLLPLIEQDMCNSEIGITIMEPKGDLVQQAAMIADIKGRPHIYFDPGNPGCPFYNPLAGPESEAIESMATSFRMLNANSPVFFLDQDEQLIRYAIKVLKRLDKAEGVDGKWATFINLGRLLQNSGSAGREIINRFRTIAAPTEDEGKENFDIAAWFINDYFAERSKAYENTSELRSQVAKLNSNQQLRSVLNPDIARGETSQIDFDKHLAEGGVLCISTNQGKFGDLGVFLGYFIILQLQAAVFRRPGNENTRRPHALYIDEFQTYANKGFSNMLTQGRSYRVACVLATQARSQMAMGDSKDGKNFVDLVSTNARNIVIFPGLNKEDAEYYSKSFGEEETIEYMKSISRKRFNPITGGLDKLGHPSESIREQEKKSAIFSVTDIIYQQFGTIIYRIIKDNSVQKPKLGTVQFIPRDLYEEVSRRVEEFQNDHQVAEGPPKSGTDIVWDDADTVEDLALGQDELMDRLHSLEDDEPESHIPESIMFEPPKKESEPELPKEEPEKPKRLEWDLLDTSGNPEDGFMDEVPDEDDFLLG